MRRMTKSWIVALVSLLVIPQLVSAARVARRQVRQDRRIERGVASGRLTGKEAARLREQQARIARQKQAAMADGQVTRKERRKVRQAQNRASRKIFRKKHNGRWTW